MTAAKEAEKGSLVTFGIVPTFPSTDYGYVKAADDNDFIRLNKAAFAKIEGDSSNINICLIVICQIWI